MIRFSELRLRNFLSHIDTKIEFDKYRGLVLIEGQNHDGHYSSNGSGKSAILEGIVYALTGETLRGVAVNDIINRSKKKNTSVSLRLDTGDKNYEVRRYRKDDIFGDSIVLSRGDEDISKRVNKETQKSLDDILNISYKILVSTILLGEGLSSRFTQLSDPEKKSLIESTLSLNYDISKIRENANSSLKDLRIRLATIEGEISVLSNLTSLDVDSLESSIKDMESCVHIYEETAAHIRGEVKEISEEIDSIRPKLELISNTLNNISSLEKDREYKADEFHRINEELQRVLSSSTPTCSLCHQELKSNESKNALLSQYQTRIDSLYSDISRVDVAISKFPESSLLKAKAENLNSAYLEKSEEYRSKLKEYNEYECKIVETKKDIETTTKNISSAKDSNSKLESKMKEKESINSEIAKYEYFYRLFSPTGIIVNILSDAVAYINSRLSTYSEVLLEKDYRLEFVKGKISIIDSKGSSYQSLSNGEKRRLDIAIQFSLHDYVHMYCGSSIDTMFIDEILDTLDDIGIENIITVLRLKLEYCKLSRIFVISHSSELKSYFDNIITVSKDKDGNSHLV